MSEEIHVNPVDESQLDDKRNEIAENVFIELDIACKGYSQNFGQDRVHEDMEFIMANVAFLLRSHKNAHTLYNIDISKVKIPNSKFTGKDGKIINEIPFLSDIDKTTYLVNLLINSKLGLEELRKSGYWDDNSTEAGMDAFLIPTPKVIFMVSEKIDECILRINVILNKL
tara:strand:+ start:137 stop:646 length:510 start_codon:yes stop_codon:yes gene_type:complete